MWAIGLTAIGLTAYLSIYRASGERFAATNAMGPGETVRLDHVMIAKKDPHTDPTHWLALEFANFMSWVEQYSKDYSVAYLTGAFLFFLFEVLFMLVRAIGLRPCVLFIHRLLRRLQPERCGCLYAAATACTATVTRPNGCECYDDWLGGDCELACPACGQRGVRLGTRGVRREPDGCLRVPRRVGRDLMRHRVPSLRLHPLVVRDGRAGSALVRVRRRVRRSVLPAGLPSVRLRG